LATICHHKFAYTRNTVLSKLTALVMMMLMMTMMIIIIITIRPNTGSSLMLGLFVHHPNEKSCFGSRIALCDKTAVMSQRCQIVDRFKFITKKKM